ncbi:MAG: amidophosphoribosyltransferase [Actinomycetota bacterium]|nr:amidophosphoribosyltransferase [Actinomycetota bacterium]
MTSGSRPCHPWTPATSSWDDYWRSLTDVDKPLDECGVFGVVAPGQDVASIAYFGLYSLQHRGQESAGISVSDGQRLSTVKDVGLVAQVFDNPAVFAGLGGDGVLALGHTRYSTTGSNKFENAQPLIAFHSSIGPIAVAHNGNLTNYSQLRQELLAKGVDFETTSDTEVIVKLLEETPGDDLQTVLRESLPRLEGAYALVLMTTTTLVGARDRLGVRPLSLGRLDTGGYVIASETCAIDTVRAQFVQDVAPGEVVCIDGSGDPTFFRAQESPREAVCMLEFIYFARPDSSMMGRNLYESRLRMGRELARQDRLSNPEFEADVVIDVPESATPAAHGYAEESGIPYRQGLVKSRYITRTFIQPSQTLRSAGVRLKFNPVRPILEGSRVVVVDDSVIRGTTTGQLVSLLRSAGAAEVHIRVASPPVHHPCFFGIDIGSREELLAVDRSEEELAEILEADSIRYLQKDGLARAVGHTIDHFCMACFDGNYPVDIPADIGKLALEPQRTAPNV